MARVDRSKGQLTADELAWVQEYLKDIPDNAPIPTEGLTLEQQVILEVYAGWSRQQAEMTVYKTYVDEVVYDGSGKPVGDLPIDRKTGKPYDPSTGKLYG